MTAASAFDSPIPVTILTGFLGSGKTTLLNRLLTRPQGRRLAVIENEFGAVNVDSEILVRNENEEIVATENGCLCCTVRGDLGRALVDFAQRREQGNLNFDHVVIETTGLAQPAPIVQTLLIDPFIEARYRLDGVVTLVDASHALEQLHRHREAQEQIAFADRVFVTKTDLVTSEALEHIIEALKDLNPEATIAHAPFGEASTEAILNVGGFNSAQVLQLHPGFPKYAEILGHNPEVSSMVYRTDAPFDRDRFEFFLQTMQEWYGPDLLRYKGILRFEDDAGRWIFQGVHRKHTLAPGQPWVNGQPQQSVLVFIGIRLPRDVLQKGLDQCRVQPE
jgi:G3E family GTPase